MTFRFPLTDVFIRITTQKRVVEQLSYATRYINLNQREFTLDVEEVGWFYVSDGNYVEVMPYEGATQSVIEVYLNGSVYGAVLHQRQTLPIHASCFQYQGSGVMICGESGVGKSSVTTAFCLDGATFLTDDVTPIVFMESKPYIWGVSDRIKLWSDSLEQLNQNEEDFDRIFPQQEKYYFPMVSAQGASVPLHQVFVLQLHDAMTVRFQEIEGAAKFSTLRNEIFRREYLLGMMASEIAYLEQLTVMSRNIRVTVVYRPADIAINQLQAQFKKLLNKTLPVEETA